MIQPAVHTLAEILTSDLGFSHFTASLKASGLLPLLEDPSGHLTILAPTDQAIKKLDRSLRESLLSGAGCAGTILKSHILPNVLCSGVIEGRARTNNLLGDLVLLERNAKGAFFVEGVELVMRDVMATNGVIHMIDDVIMPKAAKSIMDVLKEKKLTPLVEMLEANKLTEKVDSLTNVTFFLPNAAALRELPPTFLKALAADPSKLMEFMLQHVVAPRTLREELREGDLLDTEVPGQQVRVHQYSRTSTLFGETKTSVTVQCASLQGPPQEVCGGVVHTLDRVLLPTPATLLQVVSGKPQFSR